MGATLRLIELHVIEVGHRYLVAMGVLVRNAIMRRSTLSFNPIHFYTCGEFASCAESFLVIMRYLKRIGVALTAPAKERREDHEDRIEGRS